MVDYDKILDKIIRELETYELEFLVEILRLENDKRSNREILIDAIKDIEENIKNIPGGVEIADVLHDWVDMGVSIRTTEIFELYSKSHMFVEIAEDAVKEYGRPKSIVKELQYGIHYSLYNFASLVADLLMEELR